MKTSRCAVLAWIALSLVPAAVFASGPPPLPVCAVGEPEPAVLESVENALKALRIDAAKAETVRIPVAFHVITAGAEGRVTTATIKKALKSLNWGFRGTPFTFVLDRVTRTNNPRWYNDCGPESGNAEGMKKKLARDPKRVLNIYSCRPYDPSRASYVLGFGTFPFAYPEESFMQGIVLHPAGLPGGSYGPYGRVLTHEVGHYLGLFHTFAGGCVGSGDFVADTPPQSVSQERTCPVEIDTCPDQPGTDDVHNFMNYSTDACLEHFTPGQLQRMIELTGLFKPALVPW